jgi:hypothetical protein
LAEAVLEKKGYSGTAPQIIPSKLLGVVSSLGICFCQSAICNLLHRLLSVSYFDFPAVAVSKVNCGEAKEAKDLVHLQTTKCAVFFSYCQLGDVGWAGSLV